MAFSTWWAKEWHNKSWTTGALEMAFREVAESGWKAAQAQATTTNSAMVPCPKDVDCSHCPDCGECKAWQKFCADSNNMKCLGSKWAQHQ